MSGSGLATTANALFIANADGTLTPTELARGPWSAESLHGGPVAILVARAIEALPGDGIEWFVSRLTVELERPVPVQQLRVIADVTRPGRKVSVVDVTIRLAADDRILVRARAQRIRSAEIALPDHDPVLGPLLALEAPPLGPDSARAERTAMIDYVGFHNQATEHRLSSGTWNEPGPVIDWIRLRYPVVAGETPSPLQRVAAAVDFPNGIARVLSFDAHVFINPDLTIHQFRAAVGSWIAVDSRTHHGRSGVGMTDTAIYDTIGRVGRSNQSLLLDAL